MVNKEYGKKYYLEHKDQLKKYMKKYYLEHKEEITTQQKKYMVINSLKINERRKIYSKKRREGIKNIPKEFRHLRIEPRYIRREKLLQLAGRVCIRCGYRGFSLDFHHWGYQKDAKTWIESKIF